MSLPILTASQTAVIGLFLFVMTGSQFLTLLLLILDKESEQNQKIADLLVEATLLVILIALYYAYARFDRGMIGSGNIPADIPFQLKTQRQEMLLWTSLILIFVRSIFTLRYRIRRLKEGLSVLSLKEALDHLPEGILFSEKNGRILFANGQARALEQAICGSESRNADLFWQKIQAAGTRLSVGGRYWRFEQSEIPLKRRTCRQIHSFDITRAEDLIRRLEEKTLDQQKLGDKLRNALDHLNENKKQEMLLRIKYHLHTKLSYHVSVIDHILFGEDSAKRKIDKLTDIIEQELVLREDTFHEKIDNMIDVFTPFGPDLHIERFTLHSAPEPLILEIFSEAVINAVIHGRARNIWIDAVREGDELLIDIRNDGDRPQDPIHEREGLQTIRRKLEDIGGSMSVADGEYFALKIRIPDKEIKAQ